MTLLRVGFARWRSASPSGGNRYDDQLAAGLRALGVDVREHTVDGSWPDPADDDRRRLAQLLAAERDWLIPNIVGSAAPEALAAAVSAGSRVTLLMHYFPGDDLSLSSPDRRRLVAGEARAVRAASAIVVTSAWAAREVTSRYGRDDVVIALPGADRAEPAPGSLSMGRPAHLLWLGRLTRSKDPLTFVDALTRLQNLRWSAQLVGPQSLDPDLDREVRSRIHHAGLGNRVELPGSRQGDDLEAVWAHTDMLVHTSRSETYGMVVLEALTRGIPSIVPSGTGAVEAQKTGSNFPPGDFVALADGLRGWMTDPHLQEWWRADAARARADLPTWDMTARSVRRALGP